jgi:hypothetical protein
MSARQIQTILRGAGVLVSLASIYCLARALVLFLHKDWAGGVFMTLLLAYSLFVGFLTWWRFSRTAVRHICAASGFWLLMAGYTPIGLLVEDQQLRTPLAVILLVTVIWACFRMYRYSIRLLFVN